MGCAFLISATLNLSGWKKGVSKTANLLKHSEGEERHLSNIPMERGKSNSRSSTPHLLHLKQYTSFRHGWEAQKKSLWKETHFFPQAMMMHERQIHPQMPGKNSVGNQPAGKQEKNGPRKSNLLKLRDFQAPS